MARGRFVTNTLGESDKFTGLGSDTERLAFVLILTHADCEGRIKADSNWLKGKVFTLLPHTPEDIDAALQALAEARLIELYGVDGKRYAEIVNFHEHNKVRRDEKGNPTREAVSKIPSPRSDSAVTPELVHSNSRPSVKSKGLSAKREERSVKCEESSAKLDSLRTVEGETGASPEGATPPGQVAPELIEAIKQHCAHLPDFMRDNQIRGRIRTARERAEAEAWTAQEGLPPLSKRKTIAEYEIPVRARQWRQSRAN